MSFKKFFASSLLVLASASCFASGDSSLSEYSYSVYGDGIAAGTNASAPGAITVLDSLNMNGVNLRLSAWSNGNGSNVYSVSNSEIRGYRNNQGQVGYGITNLDENPHSPDHATDNIGEGFDFFLLSFDTEVTLDSANFSWLPWRVNGSVARYDQQVSVAGLNASGLSTLSSGTSSWANVAGNALVTGSFDIGSSRSNGLYSSDDFGFSTAAQYWLVGTYNTVFGSVSGASLYNDAFKLAGVDFSKSNTPTPQPKPVSAPGSLALLIAGAALMFARRQRKQA